jgi:hypothetical protein
VCFPTMKGKNLRKTSSKIFAGLISTFILGMLIISGPAQAFILSLDAEADSDGDFIFDKGKKVVFTATLDIESGENLPVDELRLVLDGPVKKVCVFDITGKAKSGVNDECHGINIKKIPLPQIDNEYGYGNGNYGYGYGYGYGYNFGYGYGYTEQKLEYEITIHTQKFSPGVYQPIFEVLIGDKTFSNKGPVINIDFEAKGSEPALYSGDEQEVETFNPRVKVNVKTKSKVNGKFYFTEYGTMPYGSVFSLPGLDKFIEIDADTIIEDDLDSALIKVYYTDSELASSGVEESELRLYYYNDDTDTWEVYDGNTGGVGDGGVNVDENYVWAITNHFSIWGLFEKEDEVVDNVDNGNSGSGSSGGSGGSCTYNKNYDWDCSKWSECVGGSQTRTCNSYNNCKSTYGKPELTRSCEIGDKKEEKVETTTEDQTKVKGRFARMTGAVTGALGIVGGWIVVVFLMVLIGSAITVRQVRRRRKIKPYRYSAFY